MKKMQITLLITLLALLLVACGGESDEDCTSADVLCVGLVTDVGEIDDKSFNQSAWEGVLRAQNELDAKVEYVETQDAKDYAANIALFADAGYDVIVTVGFALGDDTLEAAAKYPNIHFIGVDQFQGETLSNVTGLIFPEAQAGFLAGALASMLSETGSIAAVLGADLPPVVAFKDGYEAGALYINPSINLVSTYHPGGLDVAFTDPEWGATTASQAIDTHNADVVFGAGGKTGNGALIEVASRSGVYCIGVDSDQWETVPEAHACLITSAMKLITPGVFDLISASNAGSFPGGNLLGEVGLAPFHDFDSQVSQEIKTRLSEIEAGLQDGSINAGG